jgi:hypothetical protein
MSWYVEVLLLNKDSIRAKNTLASDEYMDLLLVESTVTNFCKNNLLSEIEMRVLDYMTNVALIEERQEINLDRGTISKIFKRICNRISYKLGDYFTDDGYLNYLAKKYKLSEEEVKRAKSFMESKFRHKLARKIYEEAN